MKTLFPAVIDRAADGSYGVVFPDVPGCTSAGDTLEEAVEMAEAALAQHLEVMAEIGADMPAPSELSALATERADDALAIMLIPARLPARAVRINITIDPELIERIDAVSANRSAFLASAARRELELRNSALGTASRAVGFDWDRDAATGKIAKSTAHAAKTDPKLKRRAAPGELSAPQSTWKGAAKARKR